MVIRLLELNINGRIKIVEYGHDQTLDGICHVFRSGLINIKKYNVMKYPEAYLLCNSLSLHVSYPNEKHD